MGLTGLKSRNTGLPPPHGSRGEVFSCCSQLLEAPSFIPWLVAPSSIFRASNLTPVYAFLPQSCPTLTDSAFRLLLLFLDASDYIGPTGIVQDNLSILTFAHTHFLLICHLNVPLPCHLNSHRLQGLGRGPPQVLVTLQTTARQAFRTGLCVHRVLHIHWFDCRP